MEIFGCQFELAFEWTRQIDLKSKDNLPALKICSLTKECAQPTYPVMLALRRSRRAAIRRQPTLVYQ